MTPQESTTRARQRPGSTRSRPPGPAAARKQTVAKEKQDALESPYLRDVQEFFRNLVITEKNLGLYPTYSKVVQQSVDKLFESARKALETAGPLRLQVSQTAISFQEDPVYEEAEKTKSLAFRIHKDGVREISIQTELTRTELVDLAVCLKEARKVDEEEDDFVTLFWEKDAAHVQIQLADDYLSDEDLPEVPKSRSLFSQLRLERFKIPKEEKGLLGELLEKRKAEEDENTAFEITEEEAQAIRGLVKNEEAYFALFDFVDILLELMVRNPDQDSFSRSVKMIRTIIASLVEDCDFERAAYLMQKFSTQTHPGMKDHHRRQIQEMLDTFTDKQTMLMLDTFLKENDRLAKNHPVFEFMKNFPRRAAESLCSLLKHPQHLPAMSEVLVVLGSDRPEIFTPYLSDPDPLVVRAMIGVLLQTDNDKPVERIARTLQHPDESVRVHGALVILEKGDASSGGLFIPLLAESSRQLLNIALQYFGKYTYPQAYESLESLVKSRSFNLLDQKRKQLCYKALLKASFSRGIDFVTKSVLRWPFCFGPNSREKKTAALAVLSQLESQQARATLERFAAREKGVLSTAARRFLAEARKREAKAMALEEAVQ
ncbi:MAG: hypothetical protein JXA90_11520 [Planctomycetes bacterium]|nr:hypothetical protein [Planctomycetota bacterium]